MEKFKITLTDVIITTIVLIIVIVCTIIGTRKERAKMSIETGIVGVDGFAVEVETAEDLYNALDGMHTQSMENLGEDHEVTNFLIDMMDKMHEDFDLDEDKLMAP